MQHKLSYLRDAATPTVHFRKLANEVTLLLTYEATKDFPTEPVEIETPLERMEAQRISGKKVAVCPVLRAGVGMLDGVLSLISSARVGFIGMYRDEETLQPVEYYSKLPAEIEESERRHEDAEEQRQPAKARHRQTVQSARLRAVDDAEQPRHAADRRRQQHDHREREQPAPHGLEVVAEDAQDARGDDHFVP